MTQPQPQNSKEEKYKEHIFLCHGKPSMIRNKYDENIGKFTLTCTNCNKIIYECDFINEMEEDNITSVMSNKEFVDMAKKMKNSIIRLDERKIFKHGEVK